MLEATIEFVLSIRQELAFIAFVVGICLAAWYVSPMLWRRLSLRDEIEAVMMQFADGEPIELDTLISRVQMRIKRDPSIGEVPDALIRSVITGMVEGEELSWLPCTDLGDTKRVLVFRPRITYVR